MGDVLNRLWNREPQPDVWTVDPAELLGACRLVEVCAIPGGIRILDEYNGVLQHALAPTAAGGETWTVNYWAVPTGDRNRLPHTLSEEGTHPNPMVGLALQVVEMDEPPHGTFALARNDPHTPARGRMTGPELVAFILEQYRSQLFDQLALRNLYERIPGIEITRYGGVAPFQAEGHWHGHEFYLRYRHDEVSLRIGSPRFPDRPIVSAPVWSAYMDYTGPMATVDELGTVLLALADKLVVTAALYTYKDLTPGTGKTFGPPENPTHAPSMLHITAFTRAEADAQLHARYGNIEVECISEPPEDLTDPGPMPNFSGRDTGTVRPI